MTHPKNNVIEGKTKRDGSRLPQFSLKKQESEGIDGF